MKKLLVLFSTLFIFTACSSSEEDSKKESEGKISSGTHYVYILDSEDAYTVFVNIPEDSDGAQDLIDSISKSGEGLLVKYSDFVKNEEKYFDKYIVEDGDYLSFKDFVKTLDLAPLVQIGLTWNGGIAITYNDYEYAKESYEEYLG